MNYFNQAIQTLQSWIKIKSVKSAPQKDMPFGKGVYDMLSLALQGGEKLGFKSYNYDNYVGEITWGEGEDKNGLAILCHLDVVPEGEEEFWKYPPYGAVIDNGSIYGRGVVDDKGPAVLCLYALKELKDSGFVPSKKIKLILGCDEESGWDCIEHYNKVAKMPDVGFTPDGDFPVIYAEKGLIPYKYHYPLSQNILEIKGGDRVNVVCDKASVSLKNHTKKTVELAESFGGKMIDNSFVFEGRTAHGSTPENGDNAIKKMLAFLVEIGEFNLLDYDKLFGTAIDFSSVKDDTGILTFSPNVIRVENGEIIVLVDCRHPCTYSLEEIKPLLEKVGNGEMVSYTKPLIVDRDSDLVKTLVDIYNKHNNTNKQPLAIGGGTYAKALKCGVAFGPCEIDMNICHMQNEGISLDYLKKCYEMYKQAIYELAK